MPAPSAPSNNRNRASHDVQSSSATPSTHDVVLSPTTALSMVGPSHPMPRQRVYFGPYLLLQTLGEGEFGKVKLGVHSSPERWGEEVAIKLIKRGNVDTQARIIKVAREIDVLKLVKHPNIVRLYDVIETEKYIGIVLEYASGGELFDHILAHRYLKEKDASKLFAQLISGVTYLHNKKIVHRDLKLENLLLDRNRNIIITDFGFANRFEDCTNDLMATSCGSPCYAAPELVVQDGRYVGSQVDVWSCGVILYAMLAGYLPFDDDPSNPDGDNINLLYKYIINTPLSFPEWITDQPKDLLLRMLVPDPLKRCALSDVTQHPWLAKYAHLFDRSIEELEMISEDNEQHKRTALQQQRQAIAAAAAATTGDPLGRGQSSTNPASNARTRAHQSAMVVPTKASLATAEDELIGHGAYQQQRQPPPVGTAAVTGVVTHLTSAPHHSPTGIPVAKNRRAHQAQSAVVVPTTATRQNKENEILVGAPAGMGEVYSVLSSEQKKDAEADETILVGSGGAGKKRKVGGVAGTGGTGPGSNQQRYTVQVEYSATASSEGKGKGVERGVGEHDEPMKDGTGEDVLMTPKPTNHRIPEVLVGTPPAREGAREAQATPQPHRSRRGSTPVIKVVDDRGAGGNEEEGGRSANVPFPSPGRKTFGESINANKTAVKANQSTASIATGSHLSAADTALSQQAATLSKSESSASKKDSTRHRKGMSTDRFFSRLLGNNSQMPTGPPPPLPTMKPPVVGAGGTGLNGSKSTRRKALSLVVEPLSSKIPGTSAAQRAAHRKTAKAVPITITTATDNVRSPRGASTMVSPATPRTSRRMTLIGSKKEERNGLLGKAEQPQPKPSAAGGMSMREVAGADGHESESFGRDQITGSPNWSHHTTATNAASQMSNNSKAKRVMDWFRFKSLNTSSASTNVTNQQILAGHQSGEGAILPTPFTTDFDDNRRKSRESKRVVQGAISNGSSSTRGAQGNGEEVGVVDNSAIAVSRSTQPALQSARNSTVPPPAIFNDAKLKLHHGAIDQNAISSISPPLIMMQLKKILWELGMEFSEENLMKLKVTRKSKKKVVASLGLGVFEALQQAQQQSVTAATTTTTTTTTANVAGSGASSHSGGGGGPGGFRSMFQKKVSSTSVVGPSSAGSGLIIDQFGNVQNENMAGSSINSPLRTSQAHVLQQPLPAYADDPSVDSGDDVRFTVEITRLRGLSGLYAVDIKRLKGSLWSFKYLYLQILDRAELGKQQHQQSQLH